MVKASKEDRLHYWREAGRVQELTERIANCDGSQNRFFQDYGIAMLVHLKFGFKAHLRAITSSHQNSTNLTDGEVNTCAEIDNFTKDHKLTYAISEGEP